jgi:5'-nucleotidase
LAERPHILVTNDDGIHAEGIFALAAALQEMAEVTVVAPERPRSASGHAITLHKPLRADIARLPGGLKGYATNGTPSDCVVLGLLALVKQCDLVVSGINWGYNIGDAVTYSGTVSAAMEGTIFGVPSIAVSLDDVASPDYGPAARFAARLAREVLSRGLPSGTLLNVNVPALPEAELRGVTVTRQGRHRYEGRVETRQDPRGRTYYWMDGDIVEDPSAGGSDAEAVKQGRISVTPLHLDLTAYTLADAMQQWGLQ